MTSKAKIDGWPELLEAVTHVCTNVGIEVVAKHLGVSQPFLRHALKERNRHAFKLEHLPALLKLDVAGVIREAIAPKDPPDPQDLANAYEEILAESFGLDVRAGLKSKVVARARSIATRRKGGKR